MGDNQFPPLDNHRNGKEGIATDHSLTDEPLDPSGIAQFVRHDRCPRYLKQRFEPGSEPESREWREAFNLMNVALLGSGQEFEAVQVEALAANATKIIGPDDADSTTDGGPDITYDETWASSSDGREQQLQAALTEAETLSTTTEKSPYIFCYQAPLGGDIGDHAMWGEVDCLVLAPTSADDTDEDPDPIESIITSEQPEMSPAEATAATGPAVTQSQRTETESSVVARVLEIKSARKQKPAHHIQVAIYSTLFEQTLTTLATPACRIETSVLTRETAATPGESLHPLDVPTFPRIGWEFNVERLLASGGAVDETLQTDLDDLSFSLDRVCNNCAYQEACATRAVEDPTAPASLSLLGLSPAVQGRLQDAGVASIRALSELLSRQDDIHPTDEPPTLSLPAEQQRQLEELLPGSIHETVQRAQALRGEVDPEYQAFSEPPALPDKGWIPLPDDRTNGWGSIEGSEPGELIHVGLFVKPDMAIDRVAALGACIYAEADGEYVTIGEVIDAVPDDSAVATEVEADLFERFLDQVFDAIEEVATAIGDPEDAVIHCYTYSDHEAEYLADALDRHTDTLSKARAMRGLCSLHSAGHTTVDQSMLSAVQPIITDHFALTYPSQGLLAVADQFVPGWTIDSFDPLDMFDSSLDDPPLRTIFREQFLNESVPYLDDEPGIRLHLADGLLSHSPAAEATDGDASTPAGWYPVRKRSGGQFPLEYIWAATPKQPDGTTPRLTPESVEAWADDPEYEAQLKDAVNRFYYRTSDKQESIQRSDLTQLIERLSYTLIRVVESIPSKDAYLSKEPLDATRLADFALPVTGLPAAARDYLRMEFETQREQTIDHYRQSLRNRARNGRSMPIRCTDIEQEEDGSLTISGELAYDALFADADTASQIAQQTRLRSSDGPGSGSWRVMTGLQAGDSARQSSDDSPATVADASSRDSPETTTADRNAALTVENPEEIKHSPPVLVDEFDTESGTISLTTFPHRFQSNYSEFRVDHCGWESPAGSNLDEPDVPPGDRSGYVADREPVGIEPGEVYMLDPMVDDFGSQKADYALQPHNVEHNVLWQDLRAIQNGGVPQHYAEPVVDLRGIEEFLDTVSAADQCLEPNAGQQSVIRAVEHSLVPVQGPPGTGKTGGATAPALLARAYARAQQTESFTGIVVAPSHEAVDAVLDGTIAFLNDWRQTEAGLEELELVRILPSSPPAGDDRVDDTTSAVDVTYANYNSPGGETTLETVADDIFDSEASQRLLFTTPTTLYRTLGIIAATRSEIDDESAPAAMRYSAGLADVVCVDEASMLDIPQWLLAGSTLKPAGQTLLVGDHRQLPTVTETDWTETLREPLVETNASLSALEYVHWLDDMWGGDGSRDVDDDGEKAAGEGSGEDNREATAEGDETTGATTDGGSTEPDTQQPPVDRTDPQQSALSGFASLTPDSAQFSEDEE